MNKFSYCSEQSFFSSSVFSFVVFCFSICFLYSDSLSAIALANCSSSSSCRFDFVSLYLFKKKTNASNLFFCKTKNTKSNIYFFTFEFPVFSNLDILSAYSNASLSLYLFKISNHEMHKDWINKNLIELVIGLFIDHLYINAKNQFYSFDQKVCWHFLKGPNEKFICLALFFTKKGNGHFPEKIRVNSSFKKMTCRIYVWAQ